MHRTRALRAAQQHYAAASAGGGRLGSGGGSSGPNPPQPPRAAANALQGLRIPPRGALEILWSAGSACASFFDRKERDRYIDLANKGTINPVAIGIPLSLALYNDLSNPLFAKYGLNIDEFGEGVKIALENFHNMQFRLQEDLSAMLTGEKDFAKDEVDEGVDEENGGAVTTRVSHDNAREGVTWAPTGSAEDKTESLTNEQRKQLEYLETAKERLEEWTRPLVLQELDWTKCAKDKPDSNFGQLRRMVTPEYFEEMSQVMTTQTIMLQATAASSSSSSWSSWRQTEGSGLGNTRTVLKNWSGEVMSVNLLSARAASLPSANLLTSEESVETDDGEPVVAQIEVLYDLKTTVTKVEYHEDGGGGSTTSSAENPDDKCKVASSSSSTPSSAKEEVMTQFMPIVGVFEGWLYQGSRRKKEDDVGLHWQLAMNRPFNGV